MRIPAVCVLLALVLATARGGLAREYVVADLHPGASDENPGTKGQPLKTIARAAQLAEPGDTVLVKPGLYREAIEPRNSGEPGRPITYRAEPPGGAVVLGTDFVTGWERLPGEAPVYRVPWEHRFIINTIDGQPIEHHPYGESWGDAAQWGRAEQVVVDDYMLVPQLGLEALQAAWRENRANGHMGQGAREIPEPSDAATWHGMFFPDTAGKVLYLVLADGSDPNDHTVEAATRDITFGVNRWWRPEGIHHIAVSGFIFRYGATFPQRAAVWLYGSNNVLEDCVVERTWGGGVRVNGTMRRCVVRDCGHVGGGADGEGFLNEDCLWERNCWKPINRNWDAGGFKMARASGGIFRQCSFRDNGGPGLWLDIHCRDVLITDCLFDNNEQSGVFIEISSRVRVTDSSFVDNGLRAMGDAAHIGWSIAGIQIAESRDCTVTGNTCVGNKDGITIREVGPRPLDTADEGRVVYYNRSHTITDNVLSGNLGYQLGLWYDNHFFGWHPSDREKYETEQAYEAYVATIPDEVYDPRRQAMTIDRNTYRVEPGQHLFLWGVPWRPKHRVVDDIDAFRELTGFARNGRVPRRD